MVVSAEVSGGVRCSLYRLNTAVLNNVTLLTDPQANSYVKGSCSLCR